MMRSVCWESRLFAGSSVNLILYLISEFDAICFALSFSCVLHVMCVCQAGRLLAPRPRSCTHRAQPTLDGKLAARLRVMRVAMQDTRRTEDT